MEQEVDGIVSAVISRIFDLLCILALMALLLITAVLFNCLLLHIDIVIVYTFAFMLISGSWPWAGYW